MDSHNVQSHVNSRVTLRGLAEYKYFLLCFTVLDVSMELSLQQESIRYSEHSYSNPTLHHLVNCLAQLPSQ